MTTVGYGDTFPKSHLGEPWVSGFSLWGVLLVSLFVVTVSDALEFNVPQKNAYNLIHRLINRDLMKKEAAGAILIQYRTSKASIKSKNIIEQQDGMKKYLENSRRIFKRRMTKFKALESGIRNYDTATEVTYINNQLSTFLFATLNKSIDESTASLTTNENLINMLSLLDKQEKGEE
eukprot:CAMPEP_0196994834 /NCGR_PEP_ID=MMETSP1380-20130617/1066_1 /TAXON_ID=5936 /ORGANISM="Euplotes crassus, Strain CT5" /LENGTH=176 /DNA_ID=CAMNT_0042410319 /DNA_START=933 /DNA_END=1464 /DNA_ORIENTATION=+